MAVHGIRTPLVLDNHGRASPVNFCDHHDSPCRSGTYGGPALAANLYAQVARGDMQYRMFLQAIVAYDFAFQRHALRPLDRARDSLLGLFHDLLFFLLFLLRLPGGLGLLRFLDFLLALRFQLRDKGLHHLLVAFEFLQCALLHRLVVLEVQEHALLVAHLAYKPLLFPRLLFAQAVQFHQVLFRLALFLVAFRNHRRQDFHLHSVLVQHVVHPVRLPPRVTFAGKQPVQDFRLAVAAVYIQLAHAHLHSFLTHVDFLVKGIYIPLELFHRLLHEFLVFRKFGDVDARLVQVLVQKRNRIQHALLFCFQEHEFLAFFRKVGLKLFEGVALLLDLGVSLFRGSTRKAYKQAEKNDQQTHGLFPFAPFRKQEFLDGAVTEVCGNERDQANHKSKERPEPANVFANKGNRPADRFNNHKKNRYGKAATDKPLHHALEHERELDKERASAGVLHVLDQELARQEREPHRVADNKRERHQQKEAQTNRPEHHPELPFRNAGRPVHRGLHLLEVFQAREGCNEFRKVCRILVSRHKRHAEKRRYGVLVHKVEHLARKMPAEIGQRGISAHVLDAFHAPEMFKSLPYRLYGILAHRLGQESLDRIERTFGRKHAKNAPKHRERCREKERAQENREKRRQYDRAMLLPSTKRFRY